MTLKKSGPDTAELEIHVLKLKSCRMLVFMENTVYFTPLTGIYMSQFLCLSVAGCSAHLTLPRPRVPGEGLTWSEHTWLSAVLGSVAQRAPALCWPPAARLSGACAGISSDEILPAPGGRGACISAESKCKVWSPWNSCHLHCHRRT